MVYLSAVCALHWRAGPWYTPIIRTMHALHLQHPLGPIEKCTTKMHGVKIEGINASCCLDMGVAWP